MSLVVNEHTGNMHPVCLGWGSFPQLLEQSEGEMVQVFLIATHALLGVCQRLVPVWAPFAGTGRAELKLWRQLCRKAAWDNASERTLCPGDCCESCVESQPTAGEGQGF